MSARRKARILRFAAGGLFLGVCLYLLGYIDLRRSGFFSLNYPLAYLNNKLLLDQRLVLSDQSRDAGNSQLAEFRSGVLIPLRSESDPRQLLVRLYSPLITLEFRNKRNHLEDEDDFGGTLAATICREALVRLLRRDTGLDGWKVTEGSGRYYSGEFGDGVVVVGTLKGPDTDQLIRKLREVSGCTWLRWGWPDDSGGWPDHYYSMWEVGGMKRPPAGTRVAMITLPPDESDDNNFRGLGKSWLLFLEGGHIRIQYRDGYTSG